MVNQSAGKMPDTTPLKSGVSLGWGGWFDVYNWTMIGYARIWIQSVLVIYVMSISNAVHVISKMKKIAQNTRIN